MMMALGMVLAVVVGILLGLLGGGGSILAVPVLVYVMGLGAKEAVATSLIVVALTSLGGAIQHGRAGRIRYGVGLGFGAASMAGAYLGGRVAAHLPGAVILALFGLMLLATALAMLVRRESAVVRRRSAWWIPLEGLLVGAVTGLVGAGGGFLVVPALMILGGLSMKEAVGTSLLVIALKSFAGAAGYIGHVEINWALALGFSAAALLGMVLGVRLSARVPAASLTRGFGVFVLVVGAALTAAELVRAELLAWPLAVALGVAVAALVLTVAALMGRRAVPSKA